MPDAILKNNVSGNTFYNHVNAMLFRHLGAPGSLGGNIGSPTYDNRNLFYGNYASHNVGTASYSSKLYRVSNCASGVPLNDMFHTTTTLTNNESDGNYPLCNYNVVANLGASGPATCLLLGLARITDADTVRDPLLAEFIARNAMSWAEYQDGTQWVQAAYLYEQLEQSPDVRAAYPVLDSFYTAVQDNGIDDMGNADDAFADITDSTVQADATAFALWYDNAMAANNAIDSNEQQQLDNEKLINDIYLRYSRFGVSTITPQDYNHIEQLALQCPLVGGGAVYKARMLYAIYQPALNYDDLDICNTAGYYKGGKGLFDDENAMLAQQGVKFDDNNFSVYPNPTTGILNLEYNINKTDKAAIIITDVYGKLVLEKDLPMGSRKTSVDISHLSPAIYFYRFLMNGATTNTGKIVLIK